MYQYYFNNNLN